MSAWQLAVANFRNEWRLPSGFLGLDLESPNYGKFVWNGGMGHSLAMIVKDTVQDYIWCYRDPFPNSLSNTFNSGFRVLFQVSRVWGLKLCVEGVGLPGLGCLRGSNDMGFRFRDLGLGVFSFARGLQIKVMFSVHRFFLFTL